MDNKTFYLVMRGIGKFFKDFKPNIVSLITLSTLIFVYNVFFAAGDGASSFLKHVSEVKSVRVYLQAGSDAPFALSEISRLNGVLKAVYFSPAQAKAFVEENAPGVAGMGSFSEDFFPSFIEISPENPRDPQILDNIAASASKINGVESVSYGKDVMNKFLNVSRGAMIFMIVVSGLFTISTAFVLYNTVKLSLYKFREEIRLYALVGATRSFISTPFIVSAFLTGAIAYAAGTLFFYFGLSFFNEKILFPAGINIINMPDTIYFGCLFIFVCFVSIFAAASSVKSFLKRVSSVNED